MHTPNALDNITSHNPASSKNTDLPIIQVPGIDLLTWNRFDLAFRLFYLDMQEKHPELADALYREAIRVVTQGTFKEPGNPLKNSYARYVEDFTLLTDEIKANGMDPTISLVPLSRIGTIINGSHRVAASIHAQKPVYAVQTEEPEMVCDYFYFFRSTTSPALLDMMAKTFISYAPNTHLAFLWPSGKASLKNSIAQFSRVVYQKKIQLTAQGAFNLLVELYKHMDWAGNLQNGFAGINQKLVECFPTLDEVLVVAFQADSLEETQQIKARIRAIHNIGFSSVHITDTHEEAIRISKLLFNENGIHFLNYANLLKYTPWETLSTLKKQLAEQAIDPADILIDGSTLLAMYGIRKSSDLDLLTTNPSLHLSANADIHDTELKYHRQEKPTLIYDDRFFLEYNGLKFISFNQLYALKTTRNDPKDRVDIQLMKAYIEKNSWKRLTIQLKQAVFYINLKRRILYRKNRKIVRSNIIAFLHRTGLHATVKQWIEKK